MKPLGLPALALSVCALGGASVARAPTFAASMGHDSNPAFQAVGQRPSPRATGLIRLDFDFEGPRRTFDLMGSARHVETFGEPVFTGTAYTYRTGWIEEGRPTWR